MLSSVSVMPYVQQLYPLLIVWVAACIILIYDAWSKRSNPDLNPLIALIGAVAALAVTVAQRSYSDEGLFAGSIWVDGIATLATIALLVTAVLSILLAWTYLRNRDLDHGEYYALLLLSVSGAMLMAEARDLIMVFLGLEVLSFALYVLAGFARTEERSEEASIKYFLLGAFASAFLLYGIALVYGATQTTDLAKVAAAVSAMTDQGSPMLLAGVALLLVGLGFKAAVIPFHQWTPDVYEGAPTSVTAFMAGAAKIGAFAAVFHVFNALQPVHVYWLPAVQVIAILTMVLGNILAVTQTNVKRMLAYSSIAHAGYLMVAVAALAHATSGGMGDAFKGLVIGGAMFYLLAYVFMTLGAFGVLIYLSGSGKDVQSIYDLRGLSRTHPIAAYSMLFFLLSLGGIPPTMGFMGKWQIFMGAINPHAGEYALAIVMAVASVIAVYYYLRIVYMMMFEEPTGEALPRPAGVQAAAGSIAIAALATIVFGIVPAILGPLFQVVR